MNVNEISKITMVEHIMPSSLPLASPIMYVAGITTDLPSQHRPGHKSHYDIINILILS